MWLFPSRVFSRLSREGTASALCAAYMVKHMNMSLEHALTVIRTKRPEIQPSTSYCLQLQEYEQHVDVNRKYKMSKVRYFIEKMFGYLDAEQLQYIGNTKDIMEKVSHNWIQLTIYFLLTLLFFRLLMQFIMLNVMDKDDNDEKNRLPCS